MGTYDLLTFGDDEALAHAAAAQGGRIARRFLLAVRDRVRARRLDLGWVHFFWGDERCVPPDDPESNFGMASECLLGPLGIAGGQVHRIRGEALPQVAAAEAEAGLRRIAPPGEGGQPALDLVFLGMGEEGHVASLFAGEPEELRASPAVYRAVTAAKPPPRRITLGYPAIRAAGQVWVLASGPGKVAALRQSLTPAGHTPLARVLSQRRHTRILTDLALDAIFQKNRRLHLTGGGSDGKE
jgi:6-phosphogluconolactonase